MNNAKIAYDGRVTFWNSRLYTPKSPKAPILRQSPEWELFCLLPAEGKVEFLESNLGSSHELISGERPQSRLRAPRGSKGITSEGRSLVRCAAQWLEDTYGIKHLSFLTCTLPPEALVAYTRESWAKVVHGFHQRLRYHLEQAGLSPLICSVVEIQTQRWQEEQGQPPLHLHCLFQGRLAGKSWAFPPAFYQEIWQQSCESVWASCSDWKSSTRVESLRSSSVSYLGKYMSKGVSASAPSCFLNPPAAWYSISTKLKDLVKNLTLKISGQSAHDLYEYLYSSDLMLWARSLMTEYSETGTCYLIAWIGALRSREVYWGLVAELRQIFREISNQNVLVNF